MNNKPSIKIGIVAVSRDCFPESLSVNRRKALVEAYKNKYNADEIEEQTGRRPVRAYYCSYCCGWHLTSRPNSYERKELIRRFGTEKGTEIYDITNPLITKGATIAGGILRKIKKLRHNLKYEIINCDKCRLCGMVGKTNYYQNFKFR